MKKLQLVLITIIFSLSVQAVYAQNLQDDVYIGMGASYGENIDVLGAQFNLAFAVTDNFRVATDFTHFFTYELSTDDGDYEQKMFEFNFNAHAFVINAENASIYVLAGLNYNRFENEANNLDVLGLERRDSKIGANLGGGLEFIMSQFGIFVEPKISLGGSDQFNITAGFRFRL